MTNLELAWLAGLLEGEGSFLLKKDKYPLISIEMTDEDVIRRAAVLLGRPESVLACQPRAVDHKPTWRVAVQDQTLAASLMMTLYPLMGERRRSKIKEVLSVWRRSGKRLTAAERGCTYQGCARPHRAHGVCHMHYMREMRAA